jgi:hypothetical protein
LSTVGWKRPFRPALASQLALRVPPLPATRFHSISDRPRGGATPVRQRGLSRSARQRNGRSERLSGSAVSPGKDYERPHIWHRHGWRSRTNADPFCGACPTLKKHSKPLLLRIRAVALQRFGPGPSTLPSWLCASTLAPCRAAGGFPEPEHRQSLMRAAKCPGLHIGNASIALGTTPS